MMLRRVAAAVALALIPLAAGAGCSSNPSFSVSIDQAREELRIIERNPKPLDRPLVFINGWKDVGATSFMIRHLDRHVNDDRVVIVRVRGTSTMQQARQRVIDAVDERFPTDDPLRTVEVDVIAFSMGGLVARYAADPSAGERTLRMDRLFTVASPHKGAATALFPMPDRRVRDMRRESEFLRHLNDEVVIDYELVCYGRLGDLIVGVENTAPPGMTPWWVSARFLDDSHMGAISDPRIQADILRRLRGDPSLTSGPPAPIPGTEHGGAPRRQASSR